MKLVNYWDKYTEKHGQLNVKKIEVFMCPLNIFICFVYKILILRS